MDTPLVGRIRYPSGLLRRDDKADPSFEDMLASSESCRHREDRQSHYQKGFQDVGAQDCDASASSSVDLLAMDTELEDDDELENNDDKQAGIDPTKCELWGSSAFLVDDENDQPQCSIVDTKLSTSSSRQKYRNTVKSSPRSKSLQDEKACEHPTPATKTILGLSQNLSHDEFRYDHSQLQLDVSDRAAGERLVKSDRPNLASETAEAAGQDGKTGVDDDDETVNTFPDDGNPHGKLQRSAVLTSSRRPQLPTQSAAGCLQSAQQQDPKKSGHQEGGGQRQGSSVLRGGNDDSASAVLANISNAKQAEESEENYQCDANEAAANSRIDISNKDNSKKAMPLSRPRSTKRGTHGAMPVDQVEPGTQRTLQSFPSLRMAEQATGISYKTISEAARGVRSHAGGFAWRYLVVPPGSPSTAPAADPTKTAQGQETLRAVPNVSLPARQESLDSANMTSMTAAPLGGLLTFATTKLSRGENSPKDDSIYNGSGDVEVRTMVVNRPGQLGCQVRRAKAGLPLRRLLDQSPSEAAEAFCCYVESFNYPESLAQRCGLQVGDVFVAPSDNAKCDRSSDTPRYKLVDFHAFLTLVRSGERPVTLMVARQRAQESCSRGTQLVEELFGASAVAPGNVVEATRNSGRERMTDPLRLTLTTKEPACQRPRIDSVDNDVPFHGGAEAQANAQLDSGRQNSILLANLGQANAETNGSSSPGSSMPVPFCVKCNAGQALVHHAWCPQHPHFHKSGAKFVLDRMLMGAREMACLTCQEEYRRGSRSQQAHSLQCREYSKAKAVASDPAVAMEGPSGSRAKNNGNVESQGARAARHHQIKRAGRANHQARERRSDSDNASDYEGCSLSTVELARRANLNGAGGHGHQSLPTRSKANSEKQLPPKHSRAITPMAREIADSDTEEENEGDLSVVIEWIKAPSPWGAEDYKEGDAALFTNENPGREHFEALLPSPRFEWNPFAVSKTYSMTHRTNEEGFQVIELRRDPLAQLDWGFTAERHEFGGACLVTSVDPVSPAASAVPIVPSNENAGNAGLRIHDMIVAVNGRRVGGMMRTEFECELDVSGPNLMLIVSRYKQTESIEDRLRAAEARYQEVFDSVVNDPRRIGCVDLVSGVASQSMHANAPPGTMQQESARRFEDTSEGQESEMVGIVPKAIGRHKSRSVHEQLCTPHGIDTKAYPLPRIDSVFDSKQQRSPYCRDEANQGPSHVDDGELASGANGTTERDISTTEGDVIDLDNPWLGCVCGVIHGEEVPVFWIQCDSCKSWYNVSPQCVSFSENDAKSLPVWTCWGCPLPSQHPTTTGTTDPPLLAELASPAETGTQVTVSRGKPLSMSESLSSKKSGEDRLYDNNVPAASICDGLGSSLLEPPRTTETSDPALNVEGGIVAEDLLETQKASKRRGRPRKASIIDGLDSSLLGARRTRETSDPAHKVQSGTVAEDLLETQKGSRKRGRHKKDDGLPPRSRPLTERPATLSRRATHPLSELSKVNDINLPLRHERRWVTIDAQVNPSDNVASDSSAPKRVQPSETIDESLVHYLGGWVPKDGATLHTPALSVGDRVYVSDSGRPDTGVGTVVATRVDDKCGRLYDVKFFGGRKVRNIHAYFVVLHDP